LAVRRDECRMMGIGEIVGNDDMPAVMAMHMQVEAGLLERAVRQQVSVRNIDQIGMRRIRLNYGRRSPAFPTSKIIGHSKKPLTIEPHSSPTLNVPDPSPCGAPRGPGTERNMRYSR